MKKIIIMCCLLTLFSSSTASAINKNKSYEEQKTEIITADKNLKEKEVDINSSLKKIEEDLTTLKSELIVLQKKDFIDKRQFKSTTNNQFDELMVFETLLKSDSLSSFMNNCNNLKTYSNIDKLKINDLKRDSLLNSYSELNKNYENLTNELLEISKEKEALKQEKKELDQAMSNKGRLVFNSSNLLEKSNISVAEAKKALSGTALEELAGIYVEAENTYGVNAIFIMALTAEESGWGTSKRAVKDNNLTGLGVYGDSSTGINSMTKRDNILLTTKLLKNNYLTAGGIYFNGYSIDAVNKKYCTSSDWSYKLTNIGNTLYNKIK